LAASLDLLDIHIFDFLNKFSLAFLIGFEPISPCA
jgi:hypothetical protein